MDRSKIETVVLALARRGWILQRDRAKCVEDAWREIAANALNTLHTTVEVYESVHGDALARIRVIDALAAYEATGDHSHGASDGLCVGDCWVARVAVYCLRKTDECKHLTDDAIEERVAEDLAEFYDYTDEQVRYDFTLAVCGHLSRNRAGGRGHYSRSLVE